MNKITKNTTKTDKKSKPKTKNTKTKGKKPLEKIFHLVSEVDGNSVLVSNAYTMFDEVKLIEDRPEYIIAGVYKGASGVIMNDFIVNGKILVDFGHFDGDDFISNEIGVRIKDIKVTKS